MNKQEIRSANGKLLGTIQSEGARLVARSSNGQMLGYYVEHEDKTRTSSGQIIASGNVLAGLIFDN
jgi:hypothetical protein